MPGVGHVLGGILVLGLFAWNVAMTVLATPPPLYVPLLLPPFAIAVLGFVVVLLVWCGGCVRGCNVRMMLEHSHFRRFGLMGSFLSISALFLTPTLALGSVLPFFSTDCAWNGGRVSWELVPVGWVLFGLILWHELAFFVQICSLRCPSTRSLLYRVAIVYPSSALGTSFLFSLFVAPVSLLLPSFAPTALCLACLVLGWVGVVQSVLRPTLEHVWVKGREVEAEEGKWVRVKSGEGGGEGGEVEGWSEVKIAQVTDPHIGPFLSASDLAADCRAIVSENPDIVVLTGDFFTPEGAEDCEEALHTAFAPLASLAARGRVFAILGNHDVESSTLESCIVSTLDSLHIKLLRDEATTITLAPSSRSIHLLGLDWHNPKSSPPPQDFLATLLASKAPSPPPSHTIVLVHSPGHAHPSSLPPTPLLFLAGHTHGGQVGCGPWTVVGLGTKEPDYGLWAAGHALLYVHRGQGFRSLMSAFIARLGTRPENSILHYQVPA